MESGEGRMEGGTEPGVDVFAETDDADADAPLVTRGTREAPPRDASFLVSTLNLANCAVGAGVLSVPFAVSELGVALAALFLFTEVCPFALTLDSGFLGLVDGDAVTTAPPSIYGTAPSPMRVESSGQFV